MKNKTNGGMQKMILPSLAAATLLLSGMPAGAGENFEAWRVGGDWYLASDATVDPHNEKHLFGNRGDGVLINGRTGRTPSLVTKRRDYRDVEVHLEFMVAKGSNSGVMFHGNYEVQILDSSHVRKPTAVHCGGIYPRAETRPTYRYLDEGSPPRVNAAKPPGQWQTLDIIFQSPRFDDAGAKTANAKFVRVVHNGLVIQENVEMPYANGTNWERKQFPQGPVIIQGDYGPIALRNVRVKEWNGKTDMLNAPPEGFTALFNGKDLTGWRAHPRVTEMWSVEDGVLKSTGLLEDWGADLATEKTYRDYVLMVDFRMPTQSDSGIYLRKLAPAVIGEYGDAEQFNLKTDAAMGRLSSFDFMTETMKQKLGLKAADLPRIKRAAPKTGVWHTVKLTLVGKNLTAELDGEIILDRFEYPEGILSQEPCVISFQKHRFLEGGKPGEKNPCPIEFRNIFIKEIRTPGLNVPPEGFSALFNGKDLTGWHTPPLVREYWSIEDGILKSPGLIENWGASLATKEHYRDFILLLDFRMPTLSDSGINFRRLIPEIPGFGDMEQFNLRSKGGMGHLESYYFLPKDTAAKVKLREEEKPHLRHIDPEVGVWHTVKLTMKGRTFSAEYDGEVIHDSFVYHDWMMNLEPAPIRLQKHIVVDGDNLGKMNPCPIEYRNIFIRRIAPGEVDLSSKPRRKPAEPAKPLNSPQAKLLSRIDGAELPEGYEPVKHQEYVDRRMAVLSEGQRARIGQLWKEKQEIDPEMPNRGFSFVKIMDYVAENEK